MPHCFLRTRRIWFGFFEMLQACTMVGQASACRRALKTQAEACSTIVLCIVFSDSLCISDTRAQKTTWHWIDNRPQDAILSP
jgi:hypothetical protein